MRSPTEIRQDIKETKAAIKALKKQCGGDSVELAEAREELFDLIDELEFSLTHWGDGYGY